MVDRIFAVTLLVNDELRENIECAFLRLKKIGISWLPTHSFGPHMTLCSGKVTSSRELSVASQKICAAHRQFSINSLGLGVFITETPVVYVRWPLSHSLAMLRQNFYDDTKNIWEELDKYSDPLYWVPKTTIAINDTTNRNLSSILKAIEDINLKINVTFKELALVEVKNNFEHKKRSYRLL